MTFKPSPYQEAIFKAVAEGRESLIVDAGAGCGKTSTMVKSLGYTSPRLSILFLAFNKAIAEELKARVPKHVKAGTFHSVGFRACLDHTGRNRRLSVDSNKVRSIIKDELGEREQGLYATFVNRMVGLGKGMGIGYLMPDDARSWRELADHFDISLEAEDAEEARAYELCSLILKRSVELAEQVIDFDDMLYMPLIRNTRFWQYDLVFIDEAQDTNPVQLALLKRMVKPGGRLVAVGDPRQAIYGFRGADSQAMDKIGEEFGCITLPLSISYRCSQAVVRAAQEFVPHLEWSETAPEGKVEDLSDIPLKQVLACGFEPSDAILCRNTAPLVETAYALIRQGKACRILGRDIGVGLEALIKKMNAKGIDKLVEKLEAYQGRETSKLASKGREDKAQAVEDKVMTLMVIIDNLPETRRTVPGLIQAIQDLFSDNGGKGILTLATVHKSKGLEWPRVFILGRHELMPSKWARKAWQREQEMNLLYVAYTRAMRELYFIPVPPRKERGNG